jgi:hypothetical protein
VYVPIPQVTVPDSDETVIWRYGDLPKFVSMLKRQSLYFARADKFEDPHEGSISVPELERLRAFFEERTAEDVIRVAKLTDAHTLVNCWQMSRAESEAQWRAAAGQAVAIRSTVGRLKRCFEGIRWDVYIGSVRYLDYDRDPMNVEWGWFFADDGCQRYFSKRDHFAQERELRAVVRNSSDIAHGMHVPVDLGALIESVHLAPGAHPVFREAVEWALATASLDVPVLDSRLREVPAWGPRTAEG